MLVRPLMTNLKMTVLFLHVAHLSHSVYKSSHPLLGEWAAEGVGLWTDVCHPPHKLPASDINQTFLSANLARLLAFEWQAARPPTHTFQ